MLPALDERERVLCALILLGANRHRDQALALGMSEHGIANLYRRLYARLNINSEHYRLGKWEGQCQLVRLLLRS